MYHYGIFAVIPFVLYQIYGFCISLKNVEDFLAKKIRIYLYYVLILFLQYFVCLGMRLSILET